MGDWSTRLLVDIKALYLNGKKHLGQDYQVDHSVMHTRGFISNNHHFFNLNATGSYLVRRISVNIKPHIGYIRRTTGVRVNQAPGVMNMEVISSGVELKSVFDFWFNTHLGTTVSHADYNGTKRVKSINSFIDLDFNILENLKILCKFDFHGYTTDNRTMNNHSFFDIKSIYRFSNNLRFTFTAQNIFNSSKTRDFYYEQYYSNEIRVRLAPRLFMIRADYRF